MIYLDTSVVVSLFVPEPRSQALVEWFAEQDGPFVSSGWLTTEFVSAIAIKVRRGDLSKAQMERVLKEFQQFCSSGLKLMSASKQLFLMAATLVSEVENGLRAGDSLHLATAQEAGVEWFATADKILAENARRQQLAVVFF